MHVFARSVYIQTGYRRHVYICWETQQLQVLKVEIVIATVHEPLQRIPCNVRDKVEKQIIDLQESDIIEPVEGPTPWVNPVVIFTDIIIIISLCTSHTCYI
jgi:hypothetical protein